MDAPPPPSHQQEKSNSIIGSKLLLFSIGPVQPLIAAARSTRDLWSGSYLLSTLAATGLHELQKASATIIFPDSKKHPLITLQAPSNQLHQPDLPTLLTPSLPNRFLALIPPALDPLDIAKSIRKKLKDIAEKITASITSIDHKNRFTFDHNLFLKQTTQILEIHWQTLPIDTSTQWGDQNSKTAQLLDGTKALRTFDARHTGEWKSGHTYLKDQLNGKEEAIFTVSNKLSESEIEKLSTDLRLNKQGLKPGEILGATTLIKRFWPSFYLTTLTGLPNDPDQLRKAHPMPNTHAIAQGSSEESDKSDTAAQKDKGNKYFAILAMDGDEMGQWVSGKKFTTPITQNDHTEFSKILNDFALNCAARIVSKHKGKLIYAGGDDILAMLPASTALTCARELRDAFIQIFTEKDTHKYTSIDASIGLAIAHFKSPLQDLVRTAQTAEKKAKQATKKGGHGRSAIAISILKRSGEILEWGTKWTSPGHRLLKHLIQDLDSQNLNSRFPHKLEAQLTPYLPQSQSITSDTAFEKNFPHILEKEITHTLSRNEGGQLGETQLENFTEYWNSLNGDFPHKLQLLINILRTAAWMTPNKNLKSQI
ncbi:MAG: type III-B CRISPR-associated protein Cas10/Cmr2 [Chthoniobacterales bacterium]